MDEHEENFKDIFRYTDVEYTPDGYTDVYRWDDFLVIAGDHVYSAMDTIDSVSPGGEYEGFDPQYAYTCEIVGCGDLFDGCALFRPVSHDGEDYIQIAFLRSDIDDSTGEYTERFEAGSFDMPAADALRFDLAVDLMDYFSGRTFVGEPGVSRGLEPREAVAAVEGATGCDLNFFEDFWLGSPGEIVESVHVGPYTKQSLLDFSYYAKELSRRYGFADSDILEIARHLPEECPDRFAAVKAYLDCEYVPDGDAPDEKTYRWGDFLEIAGGDARYAAMLVDRTAAGEPEEGLHPETLVDQDIRDGEAFMLAGRPIAPEDAYDLPGTVHGLYKELVDCQIDRIVDTNGTFSIEASLHDGTAYLDVRLISGVSFDGKGFRLGGELYAPGKMDLDDFHILLGNLYDAPGVGPCSLPHFAERAYGAAQESYRFGETVFDIYCETGGTDRPYKVMVSAGETVGKDAGTHFASAEEAKAWCYRYSMRELADEEKKPVPGEAASAAKKAAGCSAGDGTGDAGAIKL